MENIFTTTFSLLLLLSLLLLPYPSTAASATAAASSPCPQPFTTPLAPRPPSSSAQWFKRSSPRSIDSGPPSSKCTSTTASSRVATTLSFWAPFRTRILSVASRLLTPQSRSSSMSARAWCHAPTL
ncbi:hypothetical protein TB2_032573 [Malus domestica]